MMKLIKIALLQIESQNSIEKNLHKGIKYLKKAKTLGADIAFFPEIWSNGYNIYNRNFDDLYNDAITKDSIFVNTFKKLSKELDMAIGITYLRKDNDSIKNSITLFDRFGEEVYTYDKVHTCIFSDEDKMKSGDDFYVGCLNTKNGDLKVGSMICYDREFPESARILMLKGAELILVPNACPMEINRLSQLRARAFENMCAIATCNYPNTHFDCNGASSFFDGVAYAEESSPSRDMCTLLANEDEGIFIASLDLDFLREYREEEIHGNAYRKPEKYALLLSNDKEHPFIRNK